MTTARCTDDFVMLQMNGSSSSFQPCSPHRRQCYVIQHDNKKYIMCRLDSYRLSENVLKRSGNYNHFGSCRLYIDGALKAHSAKLKCVVQGCKLLIVAVLLLLRLQCCPEVFGSKGYSADIISLGLCPAPKAQLNLISARGRFHSENKPLEYTCTEGFPATFPLACKILICCLLINA